MTVVLTIGAFINFFVIILGVPHALWTKKPTASGALLWWLIVTLFVALFSLVSLVAAFALATSMSTAAHLILPLVVLVILWMFFTQRARATE